MSAQWLSNSTEVAGRAAGVVEGALHGLSRPARARRVRQLVLGLFALWAVLALARLVWVLVPAQDSAPAADIPVINPVSTGAAAGVVEPVDIERMMAWHLFGEAGAQLVETVVPLEPAAGEESRDGIEDGARETRLDLKLRGVVASTEDGMGYAIIEHKKRQAVYTVDDKLPVSGQVVLVKVMNRQVVLENGSKYELLTLFEQSQLDAQLVGSGDKEAPGPAQKQSGANVDKRGESDASALARNYRKQLYTNPQSLSQVVNISAVRKGGELLGYRLAPGKNREQFKQLGFKPGDLVTSVNGIELDDPSNTMRLYQTMRTASEAVFNLQRGEQQLTLSVSLADTDAAR